MSRTERPSPEEISPFEQAQPITKARTHESNKLKRKISGRDSSLNDVDVINGKKVKKASSSTNRNSDIAGGINLDIAKLNTSLLADYVARKNKQSFPQMTSMELEDMRISGKLFFCTSQVSFSIQENMLRVAREVVS